MHIRKVDTMPPSYNSIGGIMHKKLGMVNLYINAARKEVIGHV